MLSQVKSFALVGLDVCEVEVQVKISSGKFRFSIVGLADKSINESTQRVEAAILSMGLNFPDGKITVNLSPSNLPKEGSHFDLPIAIALLCAMGALKEECFLDYFILGELSLDGSIKAVNGVLAAAIKANEKNCGLICPFDNGNEAGFASKNLKILTPKSLISLISYFKKNQQIAKPDFKKSDDKIKYDDFCDVKGQQNAKRALEIAAAGGHNLLMIGPPGSGKSMLAQRLPSILPDLTNEEILEINMIYSISGLIGSGGLKNTIPFRSIHNSCSMAAMVGGGNKIKAGEITLAHLGILFLDELPEFSSQVLDSLRAPLESGKITISRANDHVTYPANFQLIAAMNPCKCGFFYDKEKRCNKAPICGQNYSSKISGPILDRIDIVINVEAVDIFDNKIFDQNRHVAIEKSCEIKKRVMVARKIQQNRYQNCKFNNNSQIDGDILDEYTKLNQETQDFLRQTIKKTDVTMRGFNRILRVARTIADLDQRSNLDKNDLIEAVSYRRIKN